MQEATLMTSQLVHIDNCADFASPKCGALLNWQNPGDPFWHYGIGLSGLHVFDTGRGLTVFERRNCLLVENVAHLHLPPRQVISRLKHALVAFADWNYSLLGWNCEHLARLIATNQPRCYQSRKVWWISGLTPTGDNPAALDVFNQYLAAHEPALIVKI